jgi:hypothetical protein
MGRCVMDLGFFLTLAAALSGNFGIGPGFALADDASRSKAAPAIGANPSSPQSIEADGAAGSWRLVRTATATAAKGEAAILHTADIERSDPRLGGSCCDAEEKASKQSSSWSNLFRRTPGRKSPCARRDKNPNLLERLFRPAREFGCPAPQRAW